MIFFKNHNSSTSLQPSLATEKKLWKKGFKRVACLDEAGRGPLAGPVVAAAVVMLKMSNVKAQMSKPFLKEIKDSKKLSPKKREELYKIITHSDFIKWGIGRVSEKVIDKINILEATKLAMKKALKNLDYNPPTTSSRSSLRSERAPKKSKFLKRTIVRFKNQVDYLILDGNFTLPAEALAKAGIDKSIPQKSIVKGDEKVFSCAAASILAKVWRDKIMERYDKKYPRYGFAKHKGYPTKLHLKMLRKYGPSKIHRKSFGPVSKFLRY